MSEDYVTPDLHPDCAPLAFLLGTWSGRGRGSYPTIEAFEYDEQITFSHSGKPFLIYAQRTSSVVDGRGLHAETGYWRPKPGGRVEVVLAHPTGIAEIEEGTVEGTSIRLETRALASTSTATRVDALARTLRIEGDVLRYTLAMAAVGEPITHHLEAELRRSSP